jgi:hypothetical protein
MAISSAPTMSKMDGNSGIMATPEQSKAMIAKIDKEIDYSGLRRTVFDAYKAGITPLRVAQIRKNVLYKMEQKESLCMTYNACARVQKQLVVNVTKAILQEIDAKKSLS